VSGKLLLAGCVLAGASAFAQSPGQPVSVNVDNFVRAESDMYIAGLLKDSGALGKFNHGREVARIEHQTVIRLNRDTMYSSAAFDLDAGRVVLDWAADWLGHAHLSGDAVPGVRRPDRARRRVGPRDRSRAGRGERDHAA
jgi:hypothetical protein